MPLVTISRSPLRQQPVLPVLGECAPRARSSRNGTAYTVVEEKCTGCGACMRVCPMGAIQFK